MKGIILGISKTVLINGLFQVLLMNRNKLIFLIIAAIFMIIMIWIGVDISSRTTFPGSKGNLKERIAPSDTLDNNGEGKKN
ncbi:hypothetical protein [Fontibacter flavus]|uniref:Uncharacterized protein n=1 Tax=Fontibacter flavus TaxID=654838 RepID=A0ABV6FSH8_9BACT